MDIYPCKRFCENLQKVLTYSKSSFSNGRRILFIAISQCESIGTFDGTEIYWEYIFYLLGDNSVCVGYCVQGKCEVLNGKPFCQ